MKRPQRKQTARPVGFRGMVLGAPELARIRRLVENRGSRQTRQDLARACCEMFDWRRANGALAVRSGAQLLVRLEAAGVLELPAPRRAQGRAPPVAAPAAALGLECWGEEPGAAAAGLVVRPIVPGERARWRALMHHHHYLGDAPLVGESLRYVALLEGEAVALLSWGAASLRNRARERYLGWDEAARRANLHRVVNNARFLVLPGAQGRHNLASRVLGANLRRLARDWQHAYGHRVVLAETFIDPARFRGTCYRASNWVYVGESAGWAKCGVRYRFHGQPKTVWLYALAREFRTLLCTCTAKEDSMMALELERLPLDGEGGLFEILRALPDPRKARGVRHRIEGLVSIALCATLAGARTITAMAEWASEQSRETLRRLGCKRGKPPSERTLRRILGQIDVEEVDRRTGRWMAEQQQRLAALALDGKTLRGSRDGETPARHLLSAVVHGTGTVLAQRSVDAKTNEITQVEPLLEDLELDGVVVTADALLTQRRLATHLVEEKKAHYVFTVKDNQPTLRSDIEALHLEDSPPQYATVDKGHGRLEQRAIWTSTAINDYARFPHLGQVFCIRRTTTDLHGNVLKGRNSTEELVYGVTSLRPRQASPAELLGHNRGHWQIENRLHHVRDVTYDEDRSQVRRHNRPHAMAALRNIAISLLRLSGAGNIAAATRHLGRQAERPLRLLGL